MNTMPYGQNFQKHLYGRKSLIDDALAEKIKHNEQTLNVQTNLQKQFDIADIRNIFNQSDLAWINENDQLHVTLSAALKNDNLLESLCAITNCAKQYDTVLNGVKTKMGTKETPTKLMFNIQARKQVVFSLLHTLQSVLGWQEIKIRLENVKTQSYASNIYELDKLCQTSIKENDGSEKNFEMYKDEIYKARRLMFLSKAEQYKCGTPIERIEYEKEEIETWKKVFSALKSTHEKYACEEYLKNFAILERNKIYKKDQIPQLEDVSRFLKMRTGFQLKPAGGIVSARDFLASLALRVFPCTQYVRHWASPHHTVEPDCIHELIGHVPMLADPTLAELSQMIGIASIGASDENVEKIATLYWFTVEFGLCRQRGELKAYGAGLLSSTGELQYAMSGTPKMIEFDPAITCVTKYQDDNYQPAYFVCDSMASAIEKLELFASQLEKPFKVWYNPLCQSLISVRSNEDVSQLVAYLKRNVATFARLIELVEMANENVM